MNKQEFERPYYVDISQLWQIITTYDYTTFLPCENCIPHNQQAWCFVQKKETYETKIECTMIQEDTNHQIILTMRLSDRAYYQVKIHLQPRKKHTLLHVTFEFIPIAFFTKLLCVFKKPKTLHIPEAIHSYIQQIETLIK